MGTILQNRSWGSRKGTTILEQALQLQKRYYVLIALSAEAVGGTGTVPSFMVNFNERFHTQVRYIRFWEENDIRVVGSIVPLGLRI